MEISKSQRDLAAIQEYDRAELREMLQNIAMSVDELRAIRRMQPTEAVEMVQSIEEVCYLLFLSENNL
jgi:son of sevenless-like protein